jgi:hypothetical protein
VKQYHITVFAEVSDEGVITGWDVCEPGSEPVFSDEAIYDTETGEWEPSADDDGSGDKANVWQRVEGYLYEMIEKGGRE